MRSVVLPPLATGLSLSLALSAVLVLVLAPGAVGIKCYNCNVFPTTARSSQVSEWARVARLESYIRKGNGDQV